MFPTLGSRTGACLSATVCLLFLCLLSACSRLEPPKKAGELVVGLRDSPAFYQVEDGVPSGYDYDLAAAFAAQLGVKLRVVAAHDPTELAYLLRKGKIHIALSMPMTDDGKTDDDPDFLYSPPQRESHFVVAYNADHVGPDSADDLAGHVVTLTANSPAHALLKGLKLTPAQINDTDNGDEIDLLEKLADHKIDLAITDSLHFNIATNFYPDLRVGFKLPGHIMLGWAFGKDEEPLYQQALAFLKTAHDDGTTARLEDRYFGHIRRINEAGIAAFLHDIQTKLPTYRHDFQMAQDLTGIDWRLLAALSYQESKWDPLATSFTGVRGMMMLTDDTADQLGVKNRLDPQESIRAGSEYLASLADELPEAVKNPDRTWLALAAYNLGMGHMNGARAIAQSLGLDPNSWYDMKKVLPLLSKPEYYHRLKSGRGRGGEAVILVENVRTYYDTLVRFEPAFKPRFW